jgi:N6-L-threonylcarbamoyladenine synthase
VTAPPPESPEALVLGIQSSWGETAAAVVRGGREILSSVVVSQAAEHAVFGGVVPEIAGRSHLRAILPVIDQALEEAGVGLDDLSTIAVTSRPGLIGSLLVGLSAGKALAWARDLPLVGVDHIEAHVHAATMELEPDDAVHPALALVASGGHTALHVARSPLDLELVATTLDDAAGEAFDKVSHLLGLGYPGGPAVSRLAEEGNPRAHDFPRYRSKEGRLAFSFSGLKTSVLYHLRGGDALAPTPAPEELERPEDVAASFQEAVVDALVEPALAVAEERGLSTILVAGGVAANRRLREVLGARAAERGMRAVFPSPAYCGDNAAMIAGLGWHLAAAGRVDGPALDASAR